MSDPFVIVQKYGGSSVKDAEHIKRVAALIKAKVDTGARVVVVVSAMGETTDELLTRAHEVSESPPRRELDMLLSCGERASMALLSMALQEAGVEAISFTGSQSGIITSDVHTGARILEVRPYRVQDELERGRVVIVAGFQGVSYKREITTLGRGGSDTTAVALAAALDARACEIYSDVAGVYSADPRVVDDAQQISALSHEEMQEFATAGAKVLNAQAVEFAKEKGIALYAKKTGSADPGTVIRKDAPPPRGGVRGVAHKARYHRLTSSLEALPALLSTLEDAGIAPLQVRADTAVAELVVDPNDAHGFERYCANLPDGCARDEDVGAVSLIGRGVLTGPIARRALEVAGDRARGISTSSYRVTVFASPADVEELTRDLHTRFVG